MTMVSSKQDLLPRLTMGHGWHFLELTFLLTALFSGVSSQNGATCNIFGTQHVLTYDRQRIDFNTGSELVASRTCPPGAQVDASFSVTVSSKLKYSNTDSVSQVECVKVVYRGYIAQICSDQSASVDGANVARSILTTNGELMVYYGTSGREISIQVGSTIIRTALTSQGRATISVPSSYRSKLCGLCGNYDGNSDNDLYTSTRVDVTALTSNIYEQGALVAQSYVVGPRSGNEVKTFTPSECFNLPNEELKMLDPELCGMYENTGSSTFESCRLNEPELTQMFLDMCKYDYCENYLTTDPSEQTSSGCDVDATCVRSDNLAKEAVNAVAEVYVDICNSLSHVVSDVWRTDYNASVKCSSGQYSSDGPYCPNVCGLKANRCSQTGIDGCVCDPGQWKDGNVCVSSNVCGCSDVTTGEYHEVSAWWVDNWCTKNYSCVATNTINTVAMQCSEDSKCTAAGCVCLPDFIGDGITCDRTCEAGEQPVNKRCEACPVGTFKESAGTDSCIACPSGQVTNEAGATSSSDCIDISLAPDSLYSISYTQVADETFKVTVPNNVLPNGLPFGGQLFRDIWISTNGVISMGKSFVGRTPTNLELVKEPLLAPFWFRQDLRVFGGISPVTNGVVELRVSTYNMLDPREDAQKEADSALKQIEILLNVSDQYRAVSQGFDPNYALVVSWKNTVPNPAVFYQYREAVYYQCIIVTNGIRTYAIFVYPAGGITLMSLFQLRIIYMGFNAQDGGVHMFNYYKSATVGIDKLDIDPSNTDLSGRWVFEVANHGPDNLYAAKCRQWYNIQKFYIFPFGVMEPLAVPCPCNSVSAKYDERFYYDYSSECAYSLNRKFSFFGPTMFQRCCYYKDGALITDPAKGGFPMFYHPLMNYAEYEVVDWTPFLHCCRSSNLCNLYREFRAVDQCEGYKAPSIACGYGDPHIYTLDQELYTYNPIGEFWMIKSEMFSMQCRMIQSLDDNLQLVEATQFGAFVMMSLTGNSSVVQVEINNNRTDFEVRVDSNSISNLLDNDVKEKVLDYSGVVIKKYNSSISVAFDTGFTFRFSLRLRVLSIQSFVPDSAKGYVDGLMGHYDGNSTNDLMSRNGTIVCRIGWDCTPRIIHYQFGESWRLEDGESLFWYRPGWSSTTYTNKNFHPVFDFNLTTVDVSVCNNDLECEYDVYLTHDQTLGQDTVNIRLEVEDKAHILGSFAPAVVGNSTVYAIVNQPMTEVFWANYSGHNTVELFALEIPPNATFERDVDSDMYTLIWIPVDLTPYLIRLSANETGVVQGTPAVSPVFEVCIKLSDDCVNGEPNFSTIAVNGSLSPTFSIVECDCQLGWVGSRCDDDYDGCVDDPCTVGNCSDVPAASYDPVNGTTYKCNIAECPAGYERKVIDSVMEPDCTDVDECRDESLCINANCSNAVGSFTCSCVEGYTFANNSTTECVNVDECEGGLDVCGDLCTDTDGSYICSCLEGYVLDNNGYSCSPELSTERACQQLNCEYACTLNGTCACPRGKSLNSDGRTCDSINECADGTDVCHRDSGATCHDLDNGYECRCPTLGYQPIKNNYDPCVECGVGFYGENCSLECACGDRALVCNATHGCVECTSGWYGPQCSIDKDECLEDPCGSSSTCVNTPGSFYCGCAVGFTNSNFTDCVNVDECTLIDPCSKLAKCTDTEGSFTCTCGSGFTGSGVQCQDINECSPDDAEEYPCVSNALCRNDLGSYKCICSEGYHGNGKINGSGCENDNECVEASNICEGSNSKCVDTLGSYVCVCIDGYYGNGETCEDVDECTDGAFNCSMYNVEHGYGGCVNEEGGYRCETMCNHGYNRTRDSSGDFIICVPYNECEASIFPCDEKTQVCTSTEESYECSCMHGFERLNTTNSTCTNIDECSRDTANCTAPQYGQVRCEDTVGSYKCVIACENGYVLGAGDTCVDLDECIRPEICDSVTEECNNLPGTYECSCKDGYTHVSDICTDINECLNASTCGDNNRVLCTNLEPFYSCACMYGYEGVNCETELATAEFIEAEQIFGLPYNSDWNDEMSEARIVFNSLMAAAIAPMYNSTPQFLGINILTTSPSNSNSTRRKRDVTGYETMVRYHAVFSDQVDNRDVIHQAIDYLINNKYMLTYNGSSITDQLMIAYPSVFDNGEVSCDTTFTDGGINSKLINCQGRGRCVHSVGEDYPMCDCYTQYEGYNCGVERDIKMDGPGNLLGLWVSVAVAGVLLLGGLLACTLVLVYQRKLRTPPLHRHPRPAAGSGRGPALFNPSSRLPTEAFNYQFPVGSIRDDLSDSASTVSTATTRTQRTDGRVGSTVPFAPRWPRAYYSQLGDPDEN